MTRASATLRWIVAGAALCTFAAVAHGQQDYPNRPIRVQIGFAAGSGADLMCRWFTTKLSEISGQSVVIENKPGAFGSIAMSGVAAAKPDGYTVLLSGNAVFAGGRYLIKDLPFTDASFTPAAMMTETPFVVTVAGSSPLKSVDELVAHLKSKTHNRFGYANVVGLVGTAYFKELTGIEAEPVSYKVASDALPDVENGTLDFMIIDGAFSVGPVKQGKLKVLAVTSDQRVSIMPDVPTMAEAGFPKFSFSPWWGVYFPAGTAESIVSKVGAWTTQVVKMPETAKYLESVAIIPVAGEPARMRARLKSDRETWDWLAGVAHLQPQ